MPSSCCSVPNCHNRGGHQYPSDSKLREKWIIAIRRLDGTTMKTWTPSKSAVVCKSHFTSSDYVKETIYGLKPSTQRLLPTAVPSIFPWSKLRRDSDNDRESRIQSREQRKRKWEETSQHELEESFASDICIQEEIVCEPDCTEVVEEVDITSLEDSTTQTPKVPMFSVENFRDDDNAIHFYTGLENYAKFMFVLQTLGPAAYCLNYIYFQVVGVSVEDQFFMTMMKLRQYKTNFEIALFFSVSETCVKNIVYTWILFMSKQWREVNMWPSQELVRYFAPMDFKIKFPKTRIIIDGTECPIKKPKAPRAQRSTFSTYKNRNTVKILVGSTPGGLVNYVSPAYCGSSSDRQIVERSNLVNSCDTGDSIMADKGFNVQDLFALKNITINIPTFFNKKNRMNGKTVLQDRKVSSKRVHIERVIGLAKTFKILTNPLTSTETKLASDITFVCFMLCNFRNSIISKYA